MPVVEVGTTNVAPENEPVTSVGIGDGEVEIGCPANVTVTAELAAKPAPDIVT